MALTDRMDRIGAIDALRGFALAGIVLGHCYEQFTAAPRPTEGFGPTPHIADYFVNGFVWIFIFGKFYSLFAILFGVSFGIMMERAASVGRNFSGRFIWRLCILLGFGLLHNALYRGDILTAYVAIGLFLPLFYRLSDRWLSLLGIALMLGVGQFLVFAVLKGPSFLPWDGAPDSPEVARYHALLAQGTFWEVARENLTHGLAHKFDFLFAIYGRGYMTLAYFFLGVWLVRHRVIDNLELHKPLLKRTLWLSLGLALVCFILAMVVFSLVPDIMQFNRWHHVFAFSFYNWFNVALTLAIACGFILLYLRKTTSKLQVFCAYGRMALSHYIAQSVLGVMIFFGFGLGLIGKLHDWQTVLIGLAIIVVQVTLSRLWLSAYRYGPLEWLWRCATDLKWLPIRLRKPQRAAPTN